MNGPDIRRLSVYEIALRHYGVTDQISQTMEELAELMVVLSKMRRFPDYERVLLASEIADVEIMLEQMKIAFQIRVEVDSERIRKLDRLHARIIDDMVKSDPIRQTGATHGKSCL